MIGLLSGTIDLASAEKAGLFQQNERQQPLAHFEKRLNHNRDSA
jgi:hypothetical protein